MNVIVGDNGVGKTALLEAIFLPLCTSTEVAVRLRAQRGLDLNFSGPARRIEDAIWRDFFYNYDASEAISLKLFGDGLEARSLSISRERAEYQLPLSPDNDGPRVSASIAFTWTDSMGKTHAATPTITSNGLRFPDTGEDMPNFFLFSSNQTVSSVENAGRFSDLSKTGKEKEFIRMFAKEYDWIDDINIEVNAGSPALYAQLHNMPEKIPLANVSGGINRVLGIMLAISRYRSVVLVDEMENGIYHQHQKATWGAVLNFMRQYKSQLFVTTHSEEWLMSLIEAADDNLQDICLWRLQQHKEGPRLYQFGGPTLKAGLESGGEIR